MIQREIRLAQSMDPTELFSYAKQLQVPVDLLRQTAKLGRLPVVNFAAGGLGNQHLLCPPHVPNIVHINENRKNFHFLLLMYQTFSIFSDPGRLLPSDAARS